MLKICILYSSQTHFTVKSSHCFEQCSICSTHVKKCENFSKTEKFIIVQEVLLSGDYGEEMLEMEMI